jgi:hypothetical protein
LPFGAIRQFIRVGFALFDELLDFISAQQMTLRTLCMGHPAMPADFKRSGTKIGFER